MRVLTPTYQATLHAAGAGAGTGTGRNYIWGCGNPGGDFRGNAAFAGWHAALSGSDASGTGTVPLLRPAFWQPVQ